MIYYRIRELREEHNLNQQTVASYLNIKQGTYSDYENGKINIPIEAFIKLADLYHVSIDYLVNRTNKDTLK